MIPHILLNVKRKVSQTEQKVLDNNLIAMYNCRIRNKKPRFNKEVITGMSEKEKKIIETIAEALPNMSERDKGYFLGYAEAKADKTLVDREQETEKEVV